MPAVPYVGAFPVKILIPSTYTSAYAILGVWLSLLQNCSYLGGSSKSYPVNLIIKTLSGISYHSIRPVSD